MSRRSASGMPGKCLRLWFYSFIFISGARTSSHTFHFVPDYNGSKKYPNTPYSEQQGPCIALVLDEGRALLRSVQQFTQLECCWFVPAAKGSGPGFRDSLRPGNQSFAAVFGKLEYVLCIYICMYTHVINR